MYGKFELYHSALDRQYYFRLLDPHSDPIGYSMGYRHKNHALIGIHSAKQHANILQNFSVFKGHDGYYYYHLRSNNKEVILRSVNYQLERDAIEAASQVVNYAPTAPIDDLSD